MRPGANYAITRSSARDMARFGGNSNALLCGAAWHKPTRIKDICYLKAYVV